MSPIRLLPPAVADAIAAGEVVERPASVVKELCENAIDAGARHVDVAVEGGGTVRIRVVDDGCGIAADELELAVARHATSKIAAADDLAGVRSLGFRGEALASIAAVAEVLITSRPPGAGGARLRVRGSEVIDRGPAASSEGTSVEVRDLFFATPARLRFMRSARGENAATLRTVADLALTHPEVALTCAIDGRSGLRSPGGSLRDALEAVFGAAAAELLDLDSPGEVAVTGAVSQPRAHRGTRGQVVLVVNGRRVHNRALAAAVEEAYRGLLPVGRHPFGVVGVSCDPADVDVNVHPAKREVRFRDEGRIYAAVQRACWQAVRGARPYVFAGPGAEVSPGGGTQPGAAGRSAALSPRGGPPVMGWPTLVRRSELREGPAEEMGDRLLELRGSPAAGPRPADGTAADGLAAVAPLRALGQSGSAWLVAESPLGVVLVDPHAAHEKVLYVDLLEAWRAASEGGPPVASQLLLLPVLVDADPRAVVRVEEAAADIAARGFGVEAFGPTAVRCTAVPVACAAGAPERLVLDLLDSLGDGGEAPGRLAALLACHSAVRLGDRLGPAEQQSLLDRLLATPGGMTCPHGRPTLVVLDEDTLRRAFRRPPG